MKTERISVASPVLRWARTSIGLNDPSVAADKLGVSPKTLSGWEDGSLSPTIKQLRKAATVYKRPLAVLLLSEPPTDFEPLRDFRRLRDGGLLEHSPELHAQLRRAQMQREVFLELADIFPDALPTAAPLPSFSLADSVDQAAGELRSFLQIDLDLQRSWKSGYDALNGWVASLEARGIIVIHTQDVAIDEIRGFSIDEWPYPVIAVNGSDWPKPRSFTLLHEMVHLSTNIGGLCDLHETRTQRHNESDAVEHFCNQVAAAALIPKEDLLGVPIVQASSLNFDWQLSDLAPVAERYWVSSEALLLRLIGLGKASWMTYWARKPEMEKEYGAAREQMKARRRSSESGPSFYTVKARNIGHGYARSVLSAFHSRAISTLDVSDYLYVKFNQIPRLESVLR